MHAADARPVQEQTPRQETPFGRLTVLAERLTRTLGVARALIISGRTVDMNGIQDGIGVLCAKTLDLPHDQARDMLPALHEIAAQVESLAAVLHPPGES
jgi:hypothetical protein